MGKVNLHDDDDVITYDAVPAGQRQEIPDREETEAERKTREFFDELNGKDSQEVGYIDIYKVAGASSFGAKDYCGREPSDKFTDPESLMMYLRENFGPGNYRITGRIDGKKGIKLNTLLSIAKRNGDENPRNLPAVIQPGGNNDLAVLIASMNQQNQQNMQMILEAIRPEKKSIFDHAIFKDKELLALLLPVAGVALKSLMSNKKDPMEQIAQLLSITGTIKDMREEERTPENTDTWPALTGKLLDQLGNILPAMASAKPLAAAPGALPAGPAPVAQGIPPIAQAFAPHLTQLVQMADGGADPQAAAQAVLGSVAPPVRDALLNFLQGDNCIGALARVNPAVIDRAVWFDELRYCILDAAGLGDDTGQTDSTGADDATTHDEPPQA